MGAGNAGLFSDDAALDVRDEFVGLVREGAEPEDATRAMLESWSDAIDYYDDGVSRVDDCVRSLRRD